MANFADIDFEEINDVTGLANDEIKCLKVKKIAKTHPSSTQLNSFFFIAQPYLSPLQVTALHCGVRWGWDVHLL